MKDRILIFGNGQIGKMYFTYFKKHCESFNCDADITDIEEVRRQVDIIKPTVVINTAAKTNLEWCENNKLDTFNTNVLGAENIARVCEEKGIYFIHFSSGCIFESKDENDIKTEESLPSPASYYAYTKVWSEQMIKYRHPDLKYLILRPRQPISAEVSYKNMLMKLLTFTQFIDNPNTGTSLEDLMEWTKVLIEKRYTGTLNVANTGWMTPYGIAVLLREFILPELPIEKITKSALDDITPVKRVDAVLDVSKLTNIMGGFVKPFDSRVIETVIELGDNIKKTDKKILKEEFNKVMEQTKLRAVPNKAWKRLLK
jgi:dTDP-4-dehydrorhamnose reductase